MLSTSCSLETNEKLISLETQPFILNIYIKCNIDIRSGLVESVMGPIQEIFKIYSLFHITNISTAQTNKKNNKKKFKEHVLPFLSYLYIPFYVLI